MPDGGDQRDRGGTTEDLNLAVGQQWSGQIPTPCGPGCRAASWLTPAASSSGGLPYATELSRPLCLQSASAQLGVYRRVLVRLEAQMRARHADYGTHRRPSVWGSGGRRFESGRPDHQPRTPDRDRLSSTSRPKIGRGSHLGGPPWGLVGRQRSRCRADHSHRGGGAVPPIGLFRRKDPRGRRGAGPSSESNRVRPAQRVRKERKRRPTLRS